MPTHVKVFWLTMTVSGLVALNGLIALVVERRHQQRPRERPPLFPFLTAAFFVLLCFLATLPTSPPFSAGQRLGWGILIGGVFALLAAWMGQNATSLYAWATLGVGLTYWRFRGYPDDALGGFALAACLVGFLLEGLRLRAKGSQHPSTLNPQPLTLNLYLVSTVSLVAALLLAQEHYSGRRFRGIAEPLWNVFPLTLPALGLVAGVLAQAARRVQRRRAWVGATLGALVVLFVFGGGAWWLTRRTFDAPSLFLPVATGIISAMVLAFLVSGVQGLKRENVLTFEETTPDLPQPPQSGGALLPYAASAVLMVLFTYLNCIRFLSGYGAALGALAMLIFFVAVDTLSEAHSDRLRHVLPLTSAMVIAALFRIFLESSNTEYHRVSLYTHYVFMGLAAGILVPWCLREMTYSGIRVFGYSSHASHTRIPLSGLLLGFACVALPPLVFVLWGFKPLVGLMAGLMFAQLLAALPAFAGDAERERFPLNLLTFSIALVAVQFTHLLIAQEDNITRDFKIRVVGVVLAAIVLVMMGQAARLWFRNRQVLKVKKG